MALSDLRRRARPARRIVDDIADTLGCDIDRAKAIERARRAVPPGAHVNRAMAWRLERTAAALQPVRAAYVFQHPVGGLALYNARTHGVLRLPDTPLDVRLPYPVAPHVILPTQAILRDHLAGLLRRPDSVPLRRASRAAARARHVAADTSPGPDSARFLLARLARVRAALADYNIAVTEDRRVVITLTRPDGARLELHPTQQQVYACVGGGPLPGQPARPIATVPALPIPPPASSARPAVPPDAYDLQVQAARAAADAAHARDCARLQARIDAEAYAATLAELAAAGL